MHLRILRETGHVTAVRAAYFILSHLGLLGPDTLQRVSDMLSSSLSLEEMSVAPSFELRSGIQT